MTKSGLSLEYAETENVPLPPKFVHQLLTKMMMMGCTLQLFVELPPKKLKYAPGGTSPVSPAVDDEVLYDR